MSCLTSPIVPLALTSSGTFLQLPAGLGLGSPIDPLTAQDRWSGSVYSGAGRAHGDQMSPGLGGSQGPSGRELRTEEGGIEHLTDTCLPASSPTSSCPPPLCSFHPAWWSRVPAEVRTGPHPLLSLLLALHGGRDELGPGVCSAWPDCNSGPLGD